VIQDLLKTVDRFAINWAVGIADRAAYWRRNGGEPLARFTNSPTVTVIYHHWHHLETRFAIASIWRVDPPSTPFGDRFHHWLHLVAMVPARACVCPCSC
jgi:hypothetical protein